jgi:hypothetical protein
MIIKMIVLRPAFQVKRHNMSSTLVTHGCYDAGRHDSDPRLMKTLNLLTCHQTLAWLSSLRALLYIVKHNTRCPCVAEDAVMGCQDEEGEDGEGTRLAYRFFYLYKQRVKELQCIGCGCGRIEVFEK